MARRRSLVARLARIVGIAALVLMGLFVALVALYTVTPPVSTLMIARTILGKPYERVAIDLGAVSRPAIAAVVASEDASFCTNGGVDWGALKEVLDRAGRSGPSRGASTITMQTAKNLFLWPGRSSIRKGIEIGMALVLGQVWSKRRTLEAYLNVAEWGEGVFGIEAAARRDFHKRAADLTLREGALLATSLPNPIRRNAARPAAFQQRLAASLEAKVQAAPDLLACLPRL